MQIGIISDIHSDIHRLNSILSFLDKKKVSQIYCCGDLVGYGLYPEEVVNEIKRRNIIAVCGNHDASLFDKHLYFLMNETAQIAIDDNLSKLSDSSLKFINELPKSFVKGDIRIVHGAPPDSIITYISYLLKSELIKIFESYQNKITFCGHVHIPEIIDYDGKKIRRIEEIEFDKPYLLEKKKRYIINAGSVSEPRDTDMYVSRCIIYDSNKKTVTFHQID